MKNYHQRNRFKTNFWYPIKALYYEIVDRTVQKVVINKDTRIEVGKVSI
jgi:hypothetical protein